MKAGRGGAARRAGPGGDLPVRKAAGTRHRWSDGAGRARGLSNLLHVVPRDLGPGAEGAGLVADAVACAEAYAVQVGPVAIKELARELMGSPTVWFGTASSD